ncbi:conjugal transfer protein TrbB, partial [Klebsiella pneumoniae]
MANFNTLIKRKQLYRLGPLLAGSPAAVGGGLVRYDPKHALRGEH